ncbi:MAG: hypothetical protein ABI852_00285 [Gemmatimonadaceae bacterium]
MMQRAKLKFGLVALLGLGACSEGSKPTASAEIDRPLSANVAEQPGQEVALGIAQALTDPTLRLSVLQAFRASPWVEHKLVLQQFIATTAGRELVTAAATARGVTAAEFTNQINALPLLDFYVPSRVERLSWSGDNVVGVALSTSMQVVPTSAYLSDGKAIDFASAHKAGRVLILLHPAEAKGRRMQRQAALMGSKIQDSDDGDVGVQFIQKLSNGDTVVYDLRKNASGNWAILEPNGSAGKELAIAMQERAAAATQSGRPFQTPSLIPCGEEGGGDCTGGGGGTPAYTNVVFVGTHEVCDMDCTASNEFEFRAVAYTNGTTTPVLQGTARITGVDSGYIYYYPWSGSVPMIATTIASGVFIEVKVVETDPWPNPDDTFDPNPALHVLADKNKTFYIGDNRATTGLCSLSEPVCKELQVIFSW